MNRVIKDLLALRNRVVKCNRKCTALLVRECSSHIKSNTALSYWRLQTVNIHTCKDGGNICKSSFKLYSTSHFRHFFRKPIRASLPTNLIVIPLNKLKGLWGHSNPKSWFFWKLVVLICTSSGLCYSLHFLTTWPSVQAAIYANPAHRNFIADIVEKAGPAVVFIEIKGKHPVSGKRVTLANGSGFIVRPNGLILTNAHVVANKSKVSVKMHNGSTYEGTVSAVDPVCDLATVKIEAETKLPIIPLGRSITIRPGEFVAAMGSPLSLHKTVTIGIVSSHLRGSRELGMNNKDMEYIQTDATIGLGNSGGPLVNLDGKAIGINTLKLTEGISFAIPSDYALELLEKADQIVSKDANKMPKYLPNGKETNKRRYVGITMLPLTPTIILELRDKIPHFPSLDGGVYIHKVVVSSPAYAGGLHAGDIIVDINGAKIQTATDVYNMVEKSEMLRVTVIRGRHTERFSVVTETL